MEGITYLCTGKKRLFPEVGNLYQLIQLRPEGGGPEEEEVHGMEEGETTCRKEEETLKECERPSSGEHT